LRQLQLEVELEVELEVQLGLCEPPLRSVAGFCCQCTNQYRLGGVSRASSSTTLPCAKTHNELQTRRETQHTSITGFHRNILRRCRQRKCC